jgi:hypothetical protein
MTLPDTCIRGILNNNFIYSDGTVGSDLFFFADPDRGDGWSPLSINWEDDESAMTEILQQTRSDGAFRFKTGAVILPKREIDRINDSLNVRGLLSYEREPLLQNDYHGNLLCSASADKRTMKQIAAGLALAISDVKWRNTDEESSDAS